jgi:5,10-methylenetetrahydromethanopterin reductase
MRIGMFGGTDASRTLDSLIVDAQRAEEAGFASYWLPQIFGFDAMTALAVIGREVARIELGTAVVPTYPRHPMATAQQALTTQAATGGRFVLGIGLSHQIVIEHMFGYSFERPARHMREYLEILMPLVHGEAVSVSGETVSANGNLTVAGATPCPVLLAALAPRMLQLAGAVADGTITWMTGPSTLTDHTIPTITKAASDAGRSAPRVCASLPVCVTDDAAAARTRAAEEFSIYSSLPSYRAMLDREGAAGPADVAIVGDAATIRAAVSQLADIGVTDFAPALFGSRDERSATREVLAGLL